MEDRKYMIFSFSEISEIDFTEVLETSAETVRLSVDGTKTFVKWEGTLVPSSVAALETKEGPYTYSEMLEILETNVWSNPNS